MVTTPAMPAEVVYDLLNDNWREANIAKPEIKQRETAQELREEIPDAGLLLIYAETGGVRIQPRGNRMYKDEIVNVVVEIHSLTSHYHFYQLAEEIIRVFEEKTRDVCPYHMTRSMSYSESYGTTYQHWKGDVRVELNRVAIRTAFEGYDGT